MYLLLHIPTNTYYGIRRRFKEKHSSSSTNNVSLVTPRYNIIGFERFGDAHQVANSIAAHQSVYNKSPNERRICLYSDAQWLVNAVEKDLWVTEVNFIDFLQYVLCFNLGLSVVHNISPPDDITGIIPVKMREYMRDIDCGSDKHSNFDFVDTLEHNLELPFEDDGY